MKIKLYITTLFDSLLDDQLIKIDRILLNFGTPTYFIQDVSVQFNSTLYFYLIYCLIFLYFSINVYSLTLKKCVFSF